VILAARRLCTLVAPRPTGNQVAPICFGAPRERPLVGRGAHESVRRVERLWPRASARRKTRV